DIAPWCLVTVSLNPVVGHSAVICIKPLLVCKHTVGEPTVGVLRNTPTERETTLLVVICKSANRTTSVCLKTHVDKIAAYCRPADLETFRTKLPGYLSRGSETALDNRLRFVGKGPWGAIQPRSPTAHYLLLSGDGLGLLR
ncbi:Hypothetical protein, putative, partial [Bodo saltans]